MVSDHAVGGEVGFTFRHALPGKALCFVKERFQQVSFVITIDALDDGNDAFETHAGIDMALGQRLKFGGRGAVVLMKTLFQISTMRAQSPLTAQT